jgi:hypothetical protein
LNGGKNKETRLIIKRVVKDNEGNLEATLLLSPDQAAFLINMGLVTLVTAGSVAVHDISEEEFKKGIEEQKQAQGNSEVTTLPGEQESAEQMTFLQNVDPQKLHKA